MTSGYEFKRPAPSGPLWALEASAGTGKTWTIENFVAAYLADGTIHPEEIVVVTFTKAATAELRSRIRNNIAAIIRGEVPSSDAGYSETERKHLRKALSDYGHLRISTIHGFAQRCLANLGQSTDGQAVVSEDDAFRLSVLTDTLRSMGTEEITALAKYKGYFKDALAALKALSNNPAAKVRTSNPTTENLALVDFVERASEQAETRKRRLNQISLSDLLTTLDKQLDDPHHLATVARSIKVLLIDEFQDTDAVQWSIFKKIRDAGSLTAFVVVGDPKQSIYGFRGGDVQVYREAVDPASANHLDGNRRSTASFVDGMNAFFAGTDFGLSFTGANDHGNLVLDGGEAVRPASIEYYPVTAEGKLKGVTDTPGWHFRRTIQTGAAARGEAISDMPAYIAGLLAGPGIPDPDTGIVRPVRLSDICILTGSNVHNETLARELMNSGVPVSLLGGGNIFSSEALNQWQHFLHALRRPTQPSSLRLFAWTWFGGSTVAEIVLNGDDETWLNQKQEHLLHLHGLFVTGKREQFFDDAIRETNILSFLAKHTNAARHITDIQHVAELLRLRTNESLDQLQDFLTRASSSADDENVDPEVEGGEWSRRVDGDAEAVQIMTIHKAKGLQFPIVLLPYMSNHPGDNKVNHIVYRAYDGVEGRTYLDLAFKSSDALKALFKAQQSSEVKRKAYVALTRAQIRNVLWTWKGGNAPNQPVLRDEKWRSENVTEGSPFFWDETPLQTYVPPTPQPKTMERARFTRSLAAPPRRNSYSSMLHQLTERLVKSTEGDHESDGPDAGSTTSFAEPIDVLGGLRGSNRLGTAIHAVLESIAQDGLPEGDELRSLVVMEAQKYGVILDSEQSGGVSVDDLLELVRRALQGDLGLVAPGKTLKDFANGRILPEVGFDLTLRSSVSTEQVLDVLRRHVDGGSSVGRWLESTQGTATELHGYLTGSIDAILVSGSDDEPRFTLVDYKTNRLPGTMDPVESVKLAMVEHNYYLQAFIYLVALHRFVRSRLGDAYRYNQHIGGAGYLFLRAMADDSAGQGVVHISLTEKCVVDLSKLFNGDLND